LVVLESNRTDPPKSFDRVVSVPVTAPSPDINVAPVLGAPQQIGERLAFPDYRTELIVENGAIAAEFLKNWFTRSTLTTVRNRGSTISLGRGESLASLDPAFLGRDVLLFSDHLLRSVAAVAVREKVAYKFLTSDAIMTSPVFDERAARLFLSDVKKGLVELPACVACAQSIAGINNWNTTGRVIAKRISSPSSSRKDWVFFMEASITNTQAPLSVDAVAKEDACTDNKFEECRCTTGCIPCTVLESFYVPDLREPMYERFKEKDSCVSAEFCNRRLVEPKTCPLMQTPANGAGAATSAAAASGAILAAALLLVANFF
jgi:hypothetical protein